MTNDEIKIPEAIASITEFKRKFSFLELYSSFVFFPRAALKLRDNGKKKLLTKHFIERLQLAVTEVNGCAACAYQHTKMALRQGMSNDEISSFLNGDDAHIKPEEAKAILFAQHFADSRAYPEKDTYEIIVKEYGEEKAKVILAACQLIITGNMYGIPFSALQSRFKSKPYKDSSLSYELGMLIFGFISLPFALIHALLRALLGFKNERFNETTCE